MFYIRFYNETGSIDFGGGGSGSYWKVTSADGLAFCGRNFSCAKYAGQDGQKTTNVTVNARTITLSGDVFCAEGFSGDFKSAMAVLENEGHLEIKTRLGTRRIKARCSDFREVETDGENPRHSGVLNAWADAILRDGKLVADGSEGINGLMLSNAMHLSSFLNDEIILPLDEDLFYEELMKRVSTSKRKENSTAVFADTSNSFDGAKK